MASWIFSSLQSLSGKLLEVVRGTSSRQEDPSSPSADKKERVRKDLEKLSQMLARIQAVQQDAEEREIHDRSVRLWLKELQGVAYQAEDVLDEFHYEVLRSIVEGGDAAIEAYHKTREGGSKRKYADMYTSSSLASSSAIANTSIPDCIAEKIKNITERFKEISEDREALYLKEEDGARVATADSHIRPPTSSHMDERAIFGREEEKEKIISLLDPSHGPDYIVLPIVGMGGLGKTTLAQLVYNDSRVCGLFGKKAWISVSEDFNLVRLTRAIIESIRDSPCGFSELSKLQDVLKKEIRGATLFLVLDDVWNEDKNLWECFRVGFLGANIVRILTTTRSSKIGEIMQTASPFPLGTLPKDLCLSLFKHFAIGTKETSGNESLLEISHAIVEKCRGVPLAIKVVGGILRSELDEEKWREVLENDIVEIDENGEISQVLNLSYRKLPVHLRPCFLLLSMFPKATSFKKDKVVRLWMAQGYVTGNPRTKKTLEEIGSGYFDELLGRSLVGCSRYMHNCYYMHDLIHDLAISISLGIQQPALGHGQLWNNSYNADHLRLTAQDGSLGSLAPGHPMVLRTLQFSGGRTAGSIVFSQNTCLRALELQYSEFPNGIDALKHLRYLSMLGVKMDTFPESICQLYSLQSLDLNGSNIVELPESIKSLINLRYLRLFGLDIEHLPESLGLLRTLHTLSLDGCNKLTKLPRSLVQLTGLCVLTTSKHSTCNLPFGIGKLTNLKLFYGSFYVMQDGTGCLGELKNLNKLSGLLYISGLKNIGDVDCCNANLASKPNLHTVFLDFDHGGDKEGIMHLDFLGSKYPKLQLAIRSSNVIHNENVEKIQECVLESLQPPENLKVLNIAHYRGIKFPSWLQHASLMSKQPARVSSLLLVKLNFINMPNLMEWETCAGHFPCLEELTIINCPKLRKIPTFSKEVRMLLIRDCGCEEIQFPSGSKIQDMQVSNCIELTSIHSMDGGLSALVKISVQDCPRLHKFRSIHELSVLEIVSLLRCPELLILPILSEKIRMLRINNCGIHEIMLPSTSEDLTISNCLELKLINWTDGGLNSIGAVTFEYCPKLNILNIPTGIKQLKIAYCGIHEIMLLSPSENLTISNCLELESINWTDGGLSSIRAVTFEYCPKLNILNIPTGIKQLKIAYCGIHEIMLSSPSENLTISNCLELESINWTDGGLSSTRAVTFEYCPKLNILNIPTGIKELKIHYCGIEEINFPAQSSIETVDVSHCSLLTSIHWVKRRLKNLRISYCPIFQLLAKDVLYSTQRAEVYDCPRTDLGKRYVYQRDASIGFNLFGNEEISLSHASVNPTIPLLENPLRLFFSKEDALEGESFTCTPSFGVSCQSIMLNLALLVILEISRCSKVISVTGLDNLNNLKRLSISYCTELCDWKDKSVPLSLKYLELEYCDKLSSLPSLSVKSHPSFLKMLVIRNCPLLTILEGFHGTMNLKTTEILHCRNLCISSGTESQFRPHHITIGGCPLLKNWFQGNSIPYCEFEVNLTDCPQGDSEAEQESAESICWCLPVKQSTEERKERERMGKQLLSFLYN